MDDLMAVSRDEQLVLMRVAASVEKKVLKDWLKGQQMVVTKVLMWGKKKVGKMSEQKVEKMVVESAVL